METEAETYSQPHTRTMNPHTVCLALLSSLETYASNFELPPILQLAMHFYQSLFYFRQLPQASLHGQKPALFTFSQARTFRFPSKHPQGQAEKDMLTRSACILQRRIRPIIPSSGD